MTQETEREKIKSAWRDKINSYCGPVGLDVLAEFVLSQTKPLQDEIDRLLCSEKTGTTWHRPLLIILNWKEKSNHDTYHRY